MNYFFSVFSFLSVFALSGLSWAAPELPPRKMTFLSRARVGFLVFWDRITDPSPNLIPEAYPFQIRKNKDEKPFTLYSEDRILNSTDAREERRDRRLENKESSDPIYTYSEYWKRECEEVQKRELEQEEKAEEIRVELLRNLNHPYLDVYFNRVWDELAADWWNENFKSHCPLPPVFLALGSPDQSLTESESEKIAELAYGLYKKGNRIFYDEDSSGASVIRSTVPRDYRLGVSGHWNQSSDRVLVILSPSIRMSLLLSLKSIIFSPESVLGLRLLKEGISSPSERLFRVFRLNNPGENDLLPDGESARSAPLKAIENLRIHYPPNREPKVFDTPKDLIDLNTYIGHQRDHRIPDFNIEDLIQSRDSKTILNIHEKATKLGQVGTHLESELDD